MIKNRILKYLDEKGFTKSSFYRETGAPNGILSQKNGISEENLLRFLVAYKDINLSWLFRGEGQMLLDDALHGRVDDSTGKGHLQSGAVAYSTIAEVLEANISDVGAFPAGLGDSLSAVRLQSVPLYEWNPASGLSDFFRDAGRLKPLCPIVLPDLPPCDGALYVRGDSMYPLLKGGDIVLYKVVAPASNNIVWGEMYLLSFLVDGEEYTTLRYLRRADDDAHVRLLGQDSRHSFTDILWEDICALALVKASVRYNTMG